MPVRTNLSDEDIEYLCVLRMYATTDYFMVSAIFNMTIRKDEENHENLMSVEDAKDTYKALCDSWPLDKRFRDAMHMRQNEPEKLRALLLKTGIDPELPWQVKIDVCEHR